MNTRQDRKAMIDRAEKVRYLKRDESSYWVVLDNKPGIGVVTKDPVRVPDRTRGGFRWETSWVATLDTAQARAATRWEAVFQALPDWINAGKV